MKMVWRVITVLLLSLCSLTICGCEGGSGGDSKGGDNPGTETPISGDAKMMVNGFPLWTANVYFDGKFIGSIPKGEWRTWSVPSGTHTFKYIIADSGVESKEETISIASGQTFMMLLSASQK